MITAALWRRRCEETRRALEAMHAKALTGKLTLAEFQALRAKLVAHASPLRGVLSALRMARRRAAKVPDFPADLATVIDGAAERITRMLAARRKVVPIAAARASRPARRRRRRARV